MLNCDNADDLALLANPTTTSLAALVGDADFLLIDEAQRVDGIGLVLKMLVDTVGTRTQVVATGSSALELAKGVFESAAGRVFEYRLYPFSFGELAAAPIIQTEIDMGEFIITGKFTKEEAVNLAAALNSKNSEGD